MDEIIRYVASHPNQMLLIGVLMLLLALYSSRKAKDFKFAQYIVAKGQFEPISNKVLEDAIRNAERDGTEDKFIALLTAIRTKYGHDGVRLGHLYWMWDVIDKKIEIDKTLEIPSFVKESND